MRIQDKDGKFVKQKFVNERFFKRMSNIQAWYIGFMSADGCISNNNQISISQSGAEGLKRIEYLKKLIKYTGNIYTNRLSTKNSNHRDSHNICFSSKTFQDKLAKYKVINNKSVLQEFPENLAQNLIPAFILGIIEGDGCCGVYVRKTKVDCLMISFCGTEKFIKKSSELIPIKASSINKCFGSNAWEIRWYGTKAFKLFDWLWKNNGNLYKGQKYSICKKYIDNKIFQHEKYDKIINKIQKKLGEKSITKIAEEENIRFQSIYRWLKTGRLKMPT